LPKKQGVIDESGEIQSIVVNPARFYDSIQIHFDQYVKKLRQGQRKQAAVDSRD
jgi:hypothetical protein